MRPVGGIAGGVQSRAVSTWSRIRAALRQEKKDVDEALDEFKDRANATLDRKERERDASPAEKMAIEADKARAADAEFDALRRRIEGGR